MKKSKFIDYAVLMAAYSRKKRRQNKITNEAISLAMKAFTMAVLSEGLRA